nr:LacI family DNA-binding transcriptional regulator [uncultured Cohaesibacter sp.]
MMMKRTPKSTIYDIAQKANASPSTVSAALNGTWKARRIRAETAERIIKIAQDFGYSTNLQARGLRTAKSGLTALLMPDYNRFFSSLAEAFSSKVRQMGLCPVIVSTDRDHDEELSTVEKLVSYAIDSLFIAGASCPEEISQYCQKAQIDHIFIDQPCALAASVTTDNVWGARQLTTEILASRTPSGDPRRDEPYFIGGDCHLPVTAGRIEGFREELQSRLGASHDHQIIASSYDTDYAEQAIKSLYGQIGGLPSALFVNSITSFEGILRFLLTLPEEEVRACSMGCFDYEPFGELLRFPVHMIRQRHRALIATAFELLETKAGPGTLIKVEPKLFSAHHRQ